MYFVRISRSKGRLRENAKVRPMCKRERRDRPYAGRPFFLRCSSRARLPDSDSLGFIAGRLTLMDRPVGCVREKKNHVPMSIGLSGSCVYVCLPASHCARGREGRKKGGAVSDGVELRSFEIRRALRGDGTRATVPCFRTARHFARLGRGGYEFIEIRGSRRRGVSPKNVGERRGAPNAREVRRSKRRRKNSARLRSV